MHVLERWTPWLRDNRRVFSLAAAVIIGGLAIAWVLIVPVADWPSAGSPVPCGRCAFRLHEMLHAAGC